MQRDLSHYNGTNRSAFIIAVWICIVITLLTLSHSNYLLFHASVELFAIVVASGVFMIAWNSRRLHDNGFFLSFGTACFFVAILQFLHMLAYKGMGVFADTGANHATQLWIAARYLLAASLCISPLFLQRKIKPAMAVAGYCLATLFLLTTIYGWNIFPACYTEGKGLTTFKIASEYLIVLMMAISLGYLHLRRQLFDTQVYRLLAVAICAFIVSDLSFTLYTDTYGITNMLGHLFNVVGFYLLYRSVIAKGLSKPFDLLFRELKQGEERYRNLYEKTPVMLHSINNAGELISVSNCWLQTLGYTFDEVLGHRLSEFMTEESRRHAEETVIPEFLRNGSVTDIPYQFAKKSGDRIDVLLTAIAEHDLDGSYLRSIGVMIDVTERNRYEQEIKDLNVSLSAQNAELEMANSDLEAFNYSVSHDLRGPLNSICGLGQVLLEVFGERLDEQCREYIANINGEAWRMNDLITTLLKFSKVGRVELKYRQFDLGELARALIAEYRMRHPERQVASKVTEGIMVNGDSSLLRITLDNLIGNAWKYTGKTPAPCIEFGATVIASEQVFFVRDNGVGFDMRKAENLFSPFKRLHVENDFEGHGVGLATAQRIIQRHGGRIWADGVPGNGATFYFTLGQP